MFSKQAFALLVPLLFFTRYFGLFWGNGYFFHPDENNMATALNYLKPNNFNPDFFAYGQLPLYLGYFLLSLLHLPNTFANSIYILRFLSATASCFGFLYFLLIYKKIFPKHSPIFPSVLFIFSPGLIQLAHYGTTESLLIALILGLIFYSLQENYFLSGLFLGLAGGLKISSFIFLAFPLFIIFLSKNKLVHFLQFVSSLVVFYLLSSPYNLLDWKNFLSSMNYETTVATGKLPVFYTSQFINSKPYLFQLQKIFPASWGLFVFILFYPSLFYCLRLFKSIKIKLLFFTCLVFFLYFGQLYVKWFRFMSPIFFLGPLLVGAFLSSLSNKRVAYFLTLGCLLPGIIFFYRYFQTDIRLQASSWMTKNLAGTAISEDRNVLELPLGNHPNLQINSFNFYDLNSDSASQLATILSQVNYIIIPSRRVFANQNQNSSQYSKDYYSKLFSGQLGFRLVKQFSLYPEFLNDELRTEETFTVFDNPTIRIYGKT